MHEFASLNHQLLPAADAFLSGTSAAALYGRGVFTTVAVYNFNPFLWNQHWRRINENAGKIGVDLSEFTEQTVKKSLLEIVGANRFRDGRARLTFYDESPTAIWGNDAKNKTSLLIQTADFRAIKKELKLTISPFPINSKSPLVNVKSCSYLENILAWEDAKEKGFDEAIRLNENGEIAAACLANVFWKKSGEIYTAPLETGCLDGTTRRFVLENLAVKEARSNLDELIEADEIFLTSAGIGVAQAKITR